MQQRLETTLFRSAATWTAIGLIGGISYREITKIADFTGFTQLSVVHTHSLALGSLVLLVTLLLVRVFGFGGDPRMRWFAWVWNAALAVTVGCLATKGIAQVAGASWADSAALAGIAGLGHIGLAAGFVLLFVALRRAIRSRPARAAQTD